QWIDVPDEEQLARYTQQVIHNTFEQVSVQDDGTNPLPPAPGIRRSPIKHIVYITKENRTYDEVYGQHPGARGDATLARYGANASFFSHDPKLPRRRVENATVMPNHLKLAREFAISDN